MTLTLALACTVFVVAIGGTSTADPSGLGELVGIPKDNDSADLTSKRVRSQSRLGPFLGVGLVHELCSLHASSDLGLRQDDGLVRHGLVKVGEVGAESNPSFDDLATLELLFDRFRWLVERDGQREGNDLVPLTGRRRIGSGDFFGRSRGRISGSSRGGRLLGRRTRRCNSRLGAVDGLSDQFVAFLLPVNIGAILKVLGVHGLKLARALVGGNSDGANVRQEGAATGGGKDELAEGQFDKLELLKMLLQLNKVGVDLFFLHVDIGNSRLDTLVRKGREDGARKLELDQSTGKEGVPALLVTLGVDEDVRGTTHTVDNLAKDRTKSPHGSGRLVVVG